MKRKALTILAVIISIAPIFAGCAQSQPCPKEGEQAPNFTLRDIAGKNVNLNEFKGMRVIINTWSTKCDDCEREMPYIQEIYAKYSSQGLTVLSINTYDSAKDAKEFVTSKGYTFPVLLDPKWEIYKKYCCPKPGSDPYTFFINAEGILKEKKFGPFQSQEEIEDILKSL